MNATYRLAAGVALIVGCTLFGRAMANAQKRRVIFLDDAARALIALKRLACERRLSAADALAECAFAPFGAVAARMRTGNESPIEAWRAVVSDVRTKPESALPRDIEALDALLARFGQGGAAEQAEWIEDVSDVIEGYADEARRKRDEAGKLYASLGALTGLALAVLLY